MQFGIYVPSRHREFTALTPSEVVSKWRNTRNMLSFSCPRPRRGFREPFVEMRYPSGASAMYYLEKYEAKKKPDLEELIHEYEEGKPILKEDFVGYAFRIIALPLRGVLVVSSLGGLLNTTVAEEAVSSVLDMALKRPNGSNRFVLGSGDLRRLCEHYLKALPQSEVYRVRATVDEVEVELKGYDVMKSEIYERIDNATQIGSSPVEGAGYRWDSDRIGRVVTMRISAPEGRGIIGVSAGKLTAEESVLLADEVIERLEDAIGCRIFELVLGKDNMLGNANGLNSYCKELPMVVPVSEIEQKYSKDSKMVAAEIQRLMRLGYQMSFDNSKGRLLIAKG